MLDHPLGQSNSVSLNTYMQQLLCSLIQTMQQALGSLLPAPNWWPTLTTKVLGSQTTAQQTAVHSTNTTVAATAAAAKASSNCHLLQRLRQGSWMWFRQLLHTSESVPNPSHLISWATQQQQ